MPDKKRNFKLTAAVIPSWLSNNWSTYTNNNSSTCSTASFHDHQVSGLTLWHGTIMVSNRSGICCSQSLQNVHVQRH